MFSSLLFLILTLLIVNLAPEGRTGAWSNGPWMSFAEGAALYVLTLATIVLQNRWILRRYPRTLTSFTLIAHMQLLLFLSAYHFFFVAHRIYSESVPGLLFSSISLTYYFFGLWVFHITSFRRKPLSHEMQTPAKYAEDQLRFLLPFTLPFLFFELLFDLVHLLPISALQEHLQNNGDPLINAILYGSITLVFLITMMIFLPALIIRLWRCTPLQDGILLERFRRLCERAGFRHGGFKLWTVMRHQHTAAIIGVVPRFRYIMFTEALLKELPADEVEAIVAHEIGHSYHRHLIIYPFVILGLVFCTAVFSLLFLNPAFHFIGLQERLDPKGIWAIAYPFALLIPFALISVLYFRFVFGFFSRNFERQADLHVFHVGVNGDAMRRALNSVAVLNGDIHHHPNWHHYSIQERMNFLELAENCPEKIQGHHRRVRWILLVYFTILAGVGAFVLSPLLPNTSGFRLANRQIEYISRSTSDYLSLNARRQAASELRVQYSLRGDSAVIQAALEETFRDYGAVTVNGLAEFYGAQLLHKFDEHPASLLLLAGAWRSFDFLGSDPSILIVFEKATYDIVQSGIEGQHIQELEILLEAMMEVKNKLEKNMNT